MTENDDHSIVQHTYNTLALMQLSYKKNISIR